MRLARVSASSLLASLLVPLLAVGLSAQAVERVDVEMNRRIREEGMQRSRVLATATMLSEGFGPRLAGSPGYRSAAEWAVAELSRFGATRAGLEPWGTRGPAWELTRHSAELIAPFYLRLHALPKAWSNPIAGTLRGVPVLVPSLATAEDRRLWEGRLRGRIVMLGKVSAQADTLARFAPAAVRSTAAELAAQSDSRDPGSPTAYWQDFDEWNAFLLRRAERQQWMAREGVQAVLEASDHELTIRSTTYVSYASSRTANLPAFTVAREQYRRLQFLVEQGQDVTVELALATRVDASDTIGVNIVAEIAGTDPLLKDEVVMIGGHFDAWHAAGGATDNAAGSAVAMEALRILAAVGAKPRRTIRVALWDGEEHEDYWGSMGYVKQHFGDPASMQLRPEHAKLSAYFNVDHGTGRIRGWYVHGNALARPILAAYMAPWADLGATMTSLENRGTTDHLPFSSVGLPAFNAKHDEIDYETHTHHTGLDGSGFLIESDLKASAVVLASLVYHVAMRDALMPRTPLPVPRR